MRVSGSVLVEICVDIAAIVHVAAQERTSLGISLGSERPIGELDPYFTWTEFATPGRKLDNDKVSIDKFSAGLTARLYLYL